MQIIVNINSSYGYGTYAEALDADLLSENVMIPRQNLTIISCSLLYSFSAKSSFQFYGKSLWIPLSHTDNSYVEEQRGMQNHVTAATCDICTYG